MANAVVTVLLLIVFVIYAVFFALWNPGVVPVTGFSWAGVDYGLPVPLFMVPLAGLLIGAIIMAIAMASPWSSMKRRLDATKDQLEAERACAKERAERIESLRRRVNELKAGARKPEPAGEPVAAPSAPPEEA